MYIRLIFLLGMFRVFGSGWWEHTSVAIRLVKMRQTFTVAATASIVSQQGLQFCMGLFPHVQYTAGP